MQRDKFIKGVLGASLFLAMDGFSSVINAMTERQNNNRSTESDQTALFATFGAVHLNVTSLEKATHFWTKIAGMKVRNAAGNMTEFGSHTETLVVVHQSAKSTYQQGYSGLYHFAINAGNKAEFAKMLYRVLANNYPCSPTDHTMSQSVYLTDPDGITIEFALETPERFKRVITTGGLKMEDADGTIRSAAASLDVDEVLKSLQDKNLDNILADDAKIGHIHLYANNVEQSNTFYKKLGFSQFNYLPQFMYADVGAGGPYKHRVAMNSWHGNNRPLAPADNAGLRFYQINFETKNALNVALNSLTEYKEGNGGYWTSDPTGNVLFLTHN